MLTPLWWQDLDADVFEWEVPERFNIAADSLDAHDADAPAIIETGARDLVVANYAGYYAGLIVVPLTT